MSTRKPSTTDELFAAAYAEHRAMVFQVILNRLGRRDYALAEDLTQNAFLNLFWVRNRIDMTRDLRGMLRTMARNAIGTHYAVMRNTREVPADTGDWAFANRALVATAGGTLKPLDAAPGDSDPDMDEALRRARAPRTLVGAR